MNIPNLPAQSNRTQPAQSAGLGVAAMLRGESVRAKFREILGEKAGAFISSVISAVSANKALGECRPESVIGAAAIAATLDLPINQSLGFAYIVPYSGVAQFQMGYKGFVQLAMRSGQYRTINVTEVYDGEIIASDRLTGTLKLDETARKSDKVVGFAAYMETLNGFSKTLYMTREQVDAHGARYSKSFNFAGSPWKSNYDAMAKKTVLKRLLSGWGILSVAMQKAVQADQGAASGFSGAVDGEITYPDSGPSEAEKQANGEPTTATGDQKRKRGRPAGATQQSNVNPPAGEPAPVSGEQPILSDNSAAAPEPSPEPAAPGPTAQQRLNRAKLALARQVGTERSAEIIADILGDGGEQGFNDADRARLADLLEKAASDAQGGK